MKQKLIFKIIFNQLQYFAIITYKNFLTHTYLLFNIIFIFPLLLIIDIKFINYQQLINQIINASLIWCSIVNLYQQIIPNPQVLGNAIGNAIAGQLQQYGVQFFTADPFAGVNFMLIDQKPDCIECICPCIGEKKNSYQISVSDQSGLLASQQLGIIKEESECAQRFFCQCWRALDLLFINNQNQIMFKAQRIYKVPSVLCLPCERPEMVVSRDSEVIGYLKQPFMCCGRSECPLPILEEIDICDPSGNTRYFISGEFVQCGCITRMCGIPRCTGPCQYIDYDIYNPMKQKVGRIRNIFNGCAQEYCSKADKFLVEFPPQCSSQDKCLILFAAITIDYDNFEYTFCNLP